MKINIQAPWEVNPYLREVIEEKSEKLATFNSRIIHIDIFLKLEEHIGTENKLVEMRVKAPGQEHFAQDYADTFEKAVANAAHKIKTQLIKKKEKRLER